MKTKILTITKVLTLQQIGPCTDSLLVIVNLATVLAPLDGQAAQKALVADVVSVDLIVAGFSKRRMKKR
jgi:hypothetical protein